MGRQVRARRRPASDRGVAAVEFALVAPILLALVYGLIAFGFTFNAQITATQLAREGARAAAICGQPSGCDTVASQKVSDNTPSGFSLVSVTVTQCASASSDATVIVLTKPPVNYPPFLTSSTAIRGRATTPCGG